MIDRRTLLKSGLALGLLGPQALWAARDLPVAADDLPALEGKLNIYQGRGEGGLYDDIVNAIRERNPKLELSVRRAPSAALANTLIEEHKAGVSRADLFWSIDASSLGAVADTGMGRPVPDDIAALIDPNFRYDEWAAISGRLRTVPFNPQRIGREQVPNHIMDFADADLRIGWAPAYGAFQSFVTAMRLLEGEQATADWLRAIKPKAKSYAGELGVVMAVARGEVDVGFANHYYVLRLKQGQPDANVEIALTENDAGSLVNSSGVVLLGDKPLAADFLRYLLTAQVQSYLAREAYEIPMARGVAPPEGIPADIQPPEVDLTQLSELGPTLDLLRDTRVL